MEAEIVKMRAYFDKPQGNCKPNPKYVEFLISLLEQSNPLIVSIIDSYSFNRDGEICMTFKGPDETLLHLNLCIRTDDGDVIIADDFDIAILYHPNLASHSTWSILDMAHSDTEQVTKLFQTFKQFETIQRLIQSLFPKTSPQ